jgi:hypothetical protein
MMIACNIPWEVRDVVDNRAKIIAYSRHGKAVGDYCGMTGGM